MSEYERRSGVLITDQDMLRQALQDVMPDQFEVSVGEELPLYGYEGDERKETAEFVVRRNHIGSATNDLGWHQNQEGVYEAIISQYDLSSNREGYGLHALEKVQQRYVTLMAMQRALDLGYQVEEVVEGDEVWLELTKIGAV